MSTKIKDLLDELCKDVKFDTRLIAKLSKIRIGFTTRNSEHIEFFGGNLCGVNAVRFLPSDREVWFREILGVPEIVIEKRLRSLDVINRNFKVTSDTFNNTAFWVTHRFLTADNLTETQRIQGATDAMLYLNYRLFTSRYVRHFERPADPQVAAAVYESLSRKFDIKVAGNWNKYFYNRVHDIISPQSIHYNTLLTMNPDVADPRSGKSESVRYAIGDIQGRIRKMLRLIAGIHYDMSRKGTKIGSSSQLVTYDGETVLKDQTKSITNYTRYLQSIVSEKRAFIKPQLVTIIQKDIVKTMPPAHFDKALNYISDQSLGRNANEINQLISDTIVHAVNYLFSNRQLAANTRDLAQILISLRGTYSSSRSTDARLLKLRKDTEDIVRRATKTNHAGNTASVRTGVLLYIVARALTKNHYS